MLGDRLRQAIDSDYVNALGTATYCFAICEWNAVYCAERISPGSLRAFLAKELTAGQIAKKFLDLTRNMPRSSERKELMGVAREFAGLVPKRNRLLHGKPCSDSEGRPRLSDNGVIDISQINEAADEFSACSIKLNLLLHGFLATYQPT